MAAAVSGRRFGHGLYRPLRMEHTADRRRHTGRRTHRGHRRLVGDHRQQAAQERPSGLSHFWVYLHGLSGQPYRLFIMVAVTGEYLPAIPASAGALIFDRAGRLLILKPTYKSGWTIPGGVMEADGATPWEACRREGRGECGIAVRRGRLACMDFRRPKPGRAGGIRLLFDCGPVDHQVMAGILVQPEEGSRYLPRGLAHRL